MTPLPVTRYERRLDEAAATGGEGSRLAAAFAAAARAARAAVPAADPHVAALRDVAAGVAAPMLAAYTLWLLDKAAARGTVRIHFLARDGQILHAIARRLAPRLYPQIDCRYLAASRQIWTRALSTSPDHHWLWYGVAPGTVTLADQLRRLAVPAEAVAGGLATAGFPPAGWDLPLDAGAMARLRGFLESPAFAAAAAPARAANRQRLLAYLAQEGLLDPGPAAIVDLGWSGSLHDSLSQLLAEEGLAPVDCYLFAIEEVKDRTWLARRHGYFFDANRGEGRDDIFARAEDRRAFLEVFCAADHGTVTGLIPGAAGRIEAEVDPSWAEPVAAWGLGQVQASIKAFAEALGDALAADPTAATAAEAEALRPVIADLLRAFWITPDPAEARAWGGFPFNLGEGHGSFTARLAEPYDLAGLPRALRGGRHLKRHEHFWVEGALAASKPPVRLLLGSARRLRRSLRPAAG